MNSTIQVKPDDHYHFITGRLAEGAVTETVRELAQQYRFAYSIGVMPITVAALMTPRWLRRHLDVPPQTTAVIVPGYCESGLEELSESLKIPVICGPKDYRWLPELFGESALDEGFGEFDIAIIAEINHAPRLPRSDLLHQAQSLRDQGADVIDFGCDPATRCLAIGDSIAALVDAGLKVSVDTFDSWEAEQATKAGATLVLSVNSQNRAAAVDWGCEVVVIPDSPEDQKSFDQTVDFLAKRGVAMRLDPILEPIGTGLTASLLRYAAVRDRYPEFEMMMGIGNLTELSDVDSAGINLLLLGICQELEIRSVLTTQVINWARSSVRECDIARRLTHFSVRKGVPPKRLSDQLVMLRDAKLKPYSEAAIETLAAELKDNNYRIIAQHDRIHLIAAAMHLTERDPFLLFERLMQQPAADNVDAGHAFYLGYEMAKASIALELSKQYEQDQSLNWGLLTRVETPHRLKRTSRHRKQH